MSAFDCDQLQNMQCSFKYFEQCIYHEGDVSKMTDFGVFFSVLECKKSKSRYPGKRKNSKI